MHSVRSPHCGRRAETTGGPGVPATKRHWHRGPPRRAALFAQAPPDLPPLDRLAWGTERVIADVARDPAPFRVLLRAMTDPGVLERVQTLVAPSQGWANAFSSAGLDRPHERARFFRAALLGVLTTLATATSPPDAEALTRELLALLPLDPDPQ